MICRLHCLTIICNLLCQLGVSLQRVAIHIGWRDLLTVFSWPLFIEVALIRNDGFAIITLGFVEDLYNLSPLKPKYLP